MHDFTTWESVLRLLLAGREAVPRTLKAAAVKVRDADHLPEVAIANDSGPCSGVACGPADIGWAVAGAR